MWITIQTDRLSLHISIDTNSKVLQTNSYTPGIFHCLSYWDRLGPGTLGCGGCSGCRECTWTNISWGTKYSKSINNEKELCLHIADKSWEKYNCHFWRTESKSRGLCMPPTCTTLKGWGGQAPSATPRPNPWTCPYPHPIEGTSSPLLSEKVNEGTWWLLQCLYAEAGVLNKAFTEFLLQHLINCSWLRKAKNSSW